MKNEEKKKIAILLPEKEQEDLLPTTRNKGIRKRAEWLSFCLSIGWGKDQLDGLGEIWDKHHDEAGNLTKSDTVGKLEEEEKSPEEMAAKEWELWRDFLYIVGSKRYLLHGEDFMATNWEDLMEILKSEGFTITRKL